MAEVAHTRFLSSYFILGNSYSLVRDAERGFASHKTVKDSQQAWLSYALDSDKLLTKAPEQGAMKIAAFEKSGMTR